MDTATLCLRHCTVTPTIGLDKNPVELRYYRLYYLFSWDWHSFFSLAINWNFISVQEKMFFFYCFHKTRRRARRWVLPLNKQYIEDSAAKGEHSILTLGFLCLTCFIKKIGTSIAFLPKPFPSFFTFEDKCRHLVIKHLVFRFFTNNTLFNSG